MIKKVLIITYYWPPDGGAGVQRWLKFVKYLRDFNWEPVVYTPENREAPVVDLSLKKDIPQNIEVITQPIWEPYSFYKRFTGKKPGAKIEAAFLNEGKKVGFTEKLSVWIRGNFFIPDARKFWIKPSVKFLSEYLEKNPVDIIVSSGPPHSMHLIANEINKKFNIPWVADFRDPWTNIDFYKDLMLTKWADKTHHKLEKKVLNDATKVIVVGETMKEEFSKIINNPSKIEVITNGFDEDDTITSEIIRDKKFSIAHIGSLVKSRNPDVLWQALSDLIKTNKELAHELEIKLVGKVDISVIQSLELYKLMPYLKRIDYLPHNEVARIQQESQVLLLLMNNTQNAKGILTGKLFEYLAAKRPILCIGPSDGDSAKVIKETNAGVVVDFYEKEKMKQVILEYYGKFKIGNLNSGGREIDQYSRKALTGKLVKILNSIQKNLNQLCAE